MPVLMGRLASRETLPGTVKPASSDALVPGASSRPMAAKTGSLFLRQCGNPDCKSGWIKLWRSRQTPILEGNWACSPACMQQMVQGVILREAAEASSGQKIVHQHRVPLGLVLLSRGSITREQLRKALEGQRKAGTGKLGEWLIRQTATEE